MNTISEDITRITSGYHPKNDSVRILHDIAKAASIFATILTKQFRRLI